MEHLLTGLIITLSLLCFEFIAEKSLGQEDLTRQKYLKQLIKVIPEDHTTPPGDQLPGTKVIS